MIKKLAGVMACYCAEKEIYPPEKKNIYAYGFELLISTALNALGILITALFMDALLGAVLFTLAFIPLRINAGGYHTKHHWSCFLMVNIVFLLFAVLVKYMSASYVLPYVVFSCMVSSMLIWALSPVEAENKPLSGNQRERLRKRSIIIASINMTLTLIFVFIPQLPLTYMGYYSSGALAASGSLIAAAASAKFKRYKT